MALNFVKIRIWEPKPRINKFLTFTFKISQISVNYLNITIYTGLRFSNCQKLDIKSLIIPLNNFQILSQKKRIYSHIRDTLKIILMTSKDIYQIVKSRSSEKEINSIITKFQEKKENSLLVYKNINKWQTSTCHGYIIQPSRQWIKKRLLKY